MNRRSEPESRPSFVAAARLTGAVAAALAAICWSAGVAAAHGGGPGLTYDPCMRPAGSDDFVHLAVYQPEFNPFAEYCETLPRAGSALLVFDLTGTALPNAPVSLQVVDRGARFQLAVPPRRYRSGVVNVRTDLPRGKYTVLVYVDEPDGRSRFVFQLIVGARWDGLVLPITIVLLIVVVTAGYCVFQMRLIVAELGNSTNNNRAEIRSLGKKQ